jgi:hypothetical protein
MERRLPDWHPDDAVQVPFPGVDHGRLRAAHRGTEEQFSSR